MKFLKRFKGKEKDVEDPLYKSMSPNEYLIYDEEHNKESYTSDEIHTLETWYKKSIFGQADTTIFTISKCDIFGTPLDPFFIIQKYRDEWFITHKCKLSNKKGRRYEILDTYICDTFDGVKQILPK